MNFADIALTGSLIAALAVSALAGLVAFLSPCTLPLMPGYVSYITGLSGSELDNGGKKGRVLLGSLLFVLGFSIVYAIIGILFQGLGANIRDSQFIIERVGGSVMILMGILFIGLGPSGAMGRTLQMKWRPAVGIAGAPLFGAVFALSWIPCTSPVLVAITSFSYIQDGAGRGVAMMLAYSLGIGLPFIAVALGLHKMAGAISFFTRHSRAIAIIGGSMLIVVGLLLVTGAWLPFITWLQSLTGGVGTGLI